MRKKNKKTVDPDVKIICRNRRARRDYQIEDTMEAGLVLEGSEVKSLRLGEADLVDSYGSYLEGELFLVGAHIATYGHAIRWGHKPRRSRKLLLKKHVLKRLGIKIRERGYTVVPLELYFRRGWAKVLLGLAKGRKQHDNRETIRRDQERREMRDVAREKNWR
jgi:SsrA-binding protein